MSKNSKQLAIISVFFTFFVAMIIYANKGCESLDCWGSSAQKGKYIDNRNIIEERRKTNKQWAFSDSFARAKIFNNNLKDFWFADWWNKDHWEYSVFPLYSSKEQCYEKAYTQATQLYLKKGAQKQKSVQKMIEVIEANAPVRCFPGGTPIVDRWKFKR